MNRGFTIIELLVTTVVILILGVLVSQIVSSTGGAIRQSKRVVDTAAQAQMAFDMIGRDLAAMISRPDVGWDFDGRPANPGMRFYAETRGPLASSRTLSLITYRLLPGSGLQRAVLPVTWEESIFGVSDWNGASAPVGPAGEEDFDVLAPGVVAFSLKVMLPGDGSPGFTFSDVSQSPDDPLPLFMVATLAILDTESLRFLDDFDPGDDAGNEEGILKQLAAAFPSDGDPTPFQAWTRTADGVVSETMPYPVATSIRVYEQLFPIPDIPASLKAQ